MLAIVATGVALTPSVGSAQQEVLQARISPQQVVPTGKPLLESIDVCLRGASYPQINVVVTAPSGEVVIDQWHSTGLDEPGVVVNDDGSWSVELQLRDDEGQPTGEPFPELGTYTIDLDCVTTYQPQVRIPYNDLSFEVVETVPTPTQPTIPVTTTPGTPPPPAVPIPRAPDFTG